MKISSIFKRRNPTSTVNYVLMPVQPVCRDKTDKATKIVARMWNRPRVNVFGTETNFLVVAIFINDVFIEELAEASAACQFAIGQDFQRLYERRLEVFRSATGGTVETIRQVGGFQIKQEE